MGRPLRSIGSLLLVLATLAAAPAGALASGPDTSGAAAAIGFLNQQRQANAIPAFASVDNSLASSWCPAESQDPVTESRVLAGGSAPAVFTADSSPWSDAPLHQVLMYDPLARSAGWATMTNASFDGGEVMPYLECMGFGNEAADPAGPTAYTFFAEQGPDAVRPSIVVQGEGPFAPQELVGISQGTPTGPQPIFYGLGMGRIRAASWSLTDQANGASVPGVGMVDSYRVQSAGYDPALLWNSAVMVPPVLKPGTVYSGHAEFTGGGGTCLDESFSFATRQSDGSPLGVHVPASTTQLCAHTAIGVTFSGSSPSGTVSMPRVVVRWTRHHLVVRASLRPGQRLTVKQHWRKASTRRHRLRLRWPRSRTVVAWVSQAGQSSHHAVVRVKRG